MVRKIPAMVWVWEIEGWVMGDNLKVGEEE